MENQELARKAPHDSTMQNYIKKMEGEIKKALPSVMTPERFTRITLSALSTNPKLGETTPNSFLGAMMTAAQLGLEPNTPLGLSLIHILPMPPEILTGKSTASPAASMEKAVEVKHYPVSESGTPASTETGAKLTKVVILFNQDKFLSLIHI